MAGLKAVILIGGLGTRLRPLTDDRPKSVLPVLNIPFIEYTFAYLKQFGIKDIILTLNYLPEVIQEYLGDGSRYGVRLAYCFEAEPMGTAGAVKNAEEYLDGTFIALNGDVFTDLNLNDMIALHRHNQAVATISLNWVDDPSAFGVVETDESLRVRCFTEKPSRDEAKTNWINAGTYILEPEALKYIPTGSHYMFEKGLFPALLDMGRPVYGFPHRGYWLDMGTPETYFNLNRDLLLKKTASPVDYGSDVNGIYCKSDVTVHPSADITPPAMLGSRCRIGRGVSIKGPVVIGDDCILEDGAFISDVLLWHNVHVGAEAGLARCIIGSGVDIGRTQQVNDSVVTSTVTAPLPGSQEQINI